MKKLAMIGWIVMSLYFCIGGISNIMITKKFEESEKLPLFKDSGLRDKNNNWFRNIAHLSASEDYERMATFYPMFKYFGETFCYILILMSFGILGSMLRILIAISVGNEKLETQQVYILPVLAAMLGLLVLVASDLLPEFRYKSGNDKLYYCVTLLAGLFTKQFLIWLENKFSSIFTSGSSESKVQHMPNTKSNESDLAST